MSDVTLHGVLNMPPELWDDSELDKIQRYKRYMQASRKIEDLNKALMALVSGNSNWAMSLSDSDEELIAKMIREVEAV